MRLGRGVAMAAAAGALVAACGSGSAGTPSASADQGGGGGTAGMTASQLCKLLTAQEIQAATGVAVGDPVPEGVNAPSCTWNGNGVAVTIAWEAPSQVGTITSALQGDNAIKLVQLQGVGDAAYYTENGTVQSNLDFRKGSNGLSVSVGFSPLQPISKIEDAEKQLGIAAAGRM